jgi:glycine/D-amino acid oxidase-like deaminating enzyme
MSQYDVAIIGGGAAGLSAAADRRKQNHLPKAKDGGMSPPWAAPKLLDRGGGEVQWLLRRHRVAGGLHTGLPSGGADECPGLVTLANQVQGAAAELRGLGGRHQMDSSPR